MNSRKQPAVSRIDRRKEKTKQSIVNAAMMLIREHGYDATTMEQIAEEADIAKGTLYNYFPVKEAIVSEFIRRTSVEKNSERLARLPALPDTRTRMMMVFSELMVGVRAQKEIFEKYFVYQLQRLVSLQERDEPKSGMPLIGSEIIRLGKQSDELRSDVPAHILEDMFEAYFVEVVKQFYKDPENFNDQMVIAQLVDLFLTGASNEK